MESESTLVWSQGRVELHTVSPIDLDLAFVIFPHDTELNDPFRNRYNLQSCLVFWVLGKEGGIFER